MISEFELKMKQVAILSNLGFYTDSIINQKPAEKLQNLIKLEKGANVKFHCK